MSKKHYKNHLVSIKNLDSESQTKTKLNTVSWNKNFVSGNENFVSGNENFVSGNESFVLENETFVSEKQSLFCWNYSRWVFSSEEKINSIWRAQFCMWCENISITGKKSITLSNKTYLYIFSLNRNLKKSTTDPMYIEAIWKNPCNSIPKLFDK